MEFSAGFCSSNNQSINQPGLAGVDGQDQRAAREEHQAAGSGGQTRQRSRRERAHLLPVGTDLLHRNQVKLGSNLSVVLSLRSGTS